MTQTYDTPMPDDTTPAADEWAALPEEQAALWRALDAWGDNFGHEVKAALRRARAALLAGKVDAVGDPGELLRVARQALDLLTPTGGDAEATATAERVVRSVTNAR